jgi:hypothetical protein
MYFLYSSFSITISFIVIGKFSIFFSKYDTIKSFSIYSGKLFIKLLLLKIYNSFTFCGIAILLFLFNIFNSTIFFGKLSTC